MPNKDKTKFYCRIPNSSKYQQQMARCRERRKTYPPIFYNTMFTSWEKRKKSAQKIVRIVKIDKLKDLEKNYRKNFKYDLHKNRKSDG